MRAEKKYKHIKGEFTNNSFIQLLNKHKIEVIYATNHAPFVESFNRTMKRMMDRYMEANDIASWTTRYKDLLNAYNNTKHSATGFAPNDIKKEDIDTVRNAAGYGIATCPSPGVPPGNPELF